LQIHIQIFVAVLRKNVCLKPRGLRLCVCVCLCLQPAAKLGRRSHKMRELISEATRTVEDSQTAQALHGLLSLKSPTDCPPSAAPTLLTSVGDLSMELIQQASARLTDEMHTAAGLDGEADLAKRPTKSLMSKSVDRHATLRAAILSPSASGLQATPTGTTGSAVQILLQMQQDDASAAQNRLVRAKLASSTTPGNVLSTAATSTAGGLNTTHVLLNRSLPVKGGVTSVAPKVTAASVPLSGVLRASDSGAGQAVPIQLIATSQGVLAIPQNYKLVAAQNTIAGVPISSPQAAATAAAGSPTKRRSASIGGLLKVARLQATGMQSTTTDRNNDNTVVQSEPMMVVANSVPPHTVTEGLATTDSSILPSQSLQTAIRDSYEKLFWKVYIQSSSLQNMSRPADVEVGFKFWQTKMLPVSE